MQKLIYLLLAGLTPLGNSASTVKLPAELPDRCTTIAVAKLSNGVGPMNTHNADCAECDFRLNKQPARDWPKGTKRPLYQYRTAYPSTVSSLRGDTWLPENLEGTDEQKKAWGTESVIEGYIDQVEHTYALYEGGYGIINEHQVAIGESTCQARFFGIPASQGGKSHIEAREMSIVALERSTTARQAIQIMGDLATKLGFYAAASGPTIPVAESEGEGGEGLTVVDKHEAWVFHVSGDDTGASAVWVAQRVPDGHIAAIANQYIIRQIDPDDKHNFMYSENIFDVAKRNNLWSEADGQLDFLKVYAPVRGHSTYATRRVWRVLSWAAPSLNLPAETDPWGDAYPFSAPVDESLNFSVQTLMAMNRDHYEGTQFDLTKGLAAGPFGTPDRYDGAPEHGVMNRTQLMSGGFERAISLFRTSYSFVATPRADKPDILAMMWFTQYAPSSSPFTPMYVAAKNPPKEYMKGSLFQFDSSVSFWNFCLIGNYLSHMYEYIIQDIKAEQQNLENAAIKAVADIEDKVSSLPKSDSENKAIELLDDFTSKHGTHTVDTWKSLFPKLVTKYHDGYTALNLTSPTINMRRNGYPEWWLRAVGYFNASNAPNKGPGVIQFQPDPAGYVSMDTHRFNVLAASLLSGCMCLVVGVVLANKRNSNQAPRGAYSIINDQNL